MNDDGAVDASDVARYRSFLANPVGAALTAAGTGKCRVYVAPLGCGLSHVVVLRRALTAPALLPGIAPLCSAAAGTSLSVALASASRRSAIIGAQGGTLSTTAPDGTRFTLTVPPDAIRFPGGQSVSLQAASSVTGLPASGGARAAAQISPDGLQFSVPAQLRIELPAPLAPSDVVAFTWAGNGEGAYFVPVVPDFEHADQVSLVLEHASGHGVAAGAPEDAAANPSPAADPDAVFQQELASWVQQATRDHVNDPEYDPADDPLWTDAVHDALDRWLNGFVVTLGGTSCAAIRRDLRSVAGWLRATDRLELDTNTFARAGEIADRLGALQTVYDALVDDLEFACELASACEQSDAIRAHFACELDAEALASLGGITFVPATIAELQQSCPAAFGALEVVPSVVEICPGASLPLTVTARSPSGATVPLGNVSWTSSDAQVLSVSAGIASSSAAGEAELTLATDCGIQLSTRAVSSPVPNLVGAYSGWGSETAWNCMNPSTDGFESGAASVEVTSQVGNGSGGAAIAGTLNGISFDGSSNFSGTVRCGGALSGAANYAQPRICYDPDTFQHYPCQVLGSTSLSGSVTSSSNGSAGSISLLFSSQDTANETCTARGSGSLTR